MLAIQYFIIVVAFLDTFIQLPILTPYALGLGASPALAGAIVGVYSLANILGNILGGLWIDKFGRRKMLLTGLILVFSSLLFYPGATRGGQLFWLRAFHGLAGGILIPAIFAYIGDRSSSKTRGKSMAFAGASIGAAAILGPAIGGFLSAKISTASVFLFAAGLFFLSIVAAFVFLQESQGQAQLPRLNFKDYLPLIKSPQLGLSSLAAFALMFSNGALAFSLPISVETMGKSAAVTGLLLSSFGFVALIVFLSPGNTIFDKLPPWNLISLGLFLISAALLILSGARTILSHLGALLVYGFGFSLVFPSMNKIVADAFAADKRGRAYGIFYAFFSLGVVAGSGVSGLVGAANGASFVTSAAFLFLATLAFTFVLKRE